MVGLGSKGSISPGKDADFVVWDPDDEFSVGAPGAGGMKIEHKHKLTPYSGETLKGRVIATYLRGEKIFTFTREDGEHKHRAGGAYGKPLLRK